MDFFETLIHEILNAGSWQNALAGVMMFCVFIIFPIAPTFLALHLLMPKAFLQKYWTDQHFQYWELNFLKTFAFGLQRTNMLCAIIGWPRLGRKRKMTKAYLDVPKWYRWLIWFWYSIFFGCGIVFIALLVGLGIYAIVPQ